MTLAFATSSTGQRIDLASGVTVGHGLVRHHDVTIAGPRAGRPELATLRADGHYATLLQTPFPVQTDDGKPVSKLTLRDLTLDGADVATLASIVSGTESAGPLVLDLQNVIIRGVHRNTIGIVNNGILTASGVSIAGNGGGIKAGLTSTSTVLRSVSVVGCSFGFDLAQPETAADNGTVPGIDIDGFTSDQMLSQNPFAEAVAPTAFDALGADVASHVVSDRSLYDTIRVLVPVATFDSARTLRSGSVRVGDRVEVPGRTWTRVVGFGPDGAALLDPWRSAGSFHETIPPSATATVYRCFYGRVWDWSATRLGLQHPSGIPTSAAWRAADGALLGTPVMGDGVLVDVIRHGISETASVRDYDTGAIHITAAGLNPIVRRASTHDTGSDGQSYRAVGTRVESCLHRLSRDMGFTVDGSAGPQTLMHCQASGAGMNGFWVGEGPSYLYGVTADGCGAHGHEHGIHVTDAALESVVQCDGRGNALGLCNRMDLCKPYPRTVARSRSLSLRRWRWR